MFVPVVEAELAFSLRMQTLLKQTSDHQEALKAFLEKRKPKFTGN